MDQSHRFLKKDFSQPYISHDLSDTLILKITQFSGQRGIFQLKNFEEINKKFFFQKIFSNKLLKRLIHNK